MLYRGYGYMGYSPWSGIGAFFFILFWALVVFLFIKLLIFLFSGMREGAHRMSDKHEQENNKSAIDILKERYARGEIKKDEFEQIKKDLT
jgi:putative membrane protein